MFGVRTLSDITLTDVMERLTPPGNTVVCTTSDLKINLGESPAVSIFTGGEEVEQVSTNGARSAFATLLRIPEAYLNRIPDDLAEVTINRLLAVNPGEVKIRYGDDYIYDIYPSNRVSIDPRAVVEIAAEVVGEDAQVVEFWSGGDFRLDVITSEDSGIGVVGDPQVGDISRAGLRFSQNISKNLSPTVQKYFMRLVCTNGLEVPDTSAKVDGRGNSVDEFLASFEIEARRLAFEVEADMRHFYDLRNIPVADPSQTVLRLAREAGLSDRMQIGLVELVPEIEGENGTSMFDVVNLFTNTAIDRRIKPGPRRQLEQLAGGIVNDHVARCNVCSSRLN